MSTTLDERVAALVADEGHRQLLARLRTRLERGGSPATVQLRGLGAAERRALADLLGHATRPDPDVRVSIVDLDAALRSSRVGAGLAEVLEALGGPLADRRAARRERQRQWELLWRELRADTDAPWWRQAWVEGLQRGTLKRLADDVDEARALCDAALAVSTILPADGMPLAALAARATGDPHALDHGRALTVVVQAALAAQQGRSPDQPVDARQRRELWEVAGIQCDPLSTTVLVQNLRVDGPGLLSTTLRQHADAGEPVRLTLRQLRDASLSLRGAAVHVCENPSVTAAAADVLGAGCRPLVCVEGIPSTAAQVLFDALGEVEFRVHADFDAGGVRIGNLVLRRDGAVPWRFRTDDYLAALDTVDHTVPVTGPVDVASWDPRLSTALAAHGQAVHEEQVLPLLLGDLAMR